MRSGRSVQPSFTQPDQNALMNLETRPLRIEERMKSLVEGHRLCSHPFFAQLRVARSKSLLQRFALEQFYMSISLAPCFAALSARTPIFAWRDRAALMDLAAEETWGLGDDNHGEAFLPFAEAVGVSLADAESHVPHPATLNAAETRLAIARGELSSDLSACLYAIAFANEHANLFIFGKMRAALKRSSGAQDVDCDYLSAHVEDEADHAQALLVVARRFMTEGTESEAEHLVSKLLDVRSTFFDALGGQRDARVSSLPSCVGVDESISA